MLPAVAPNSGAALAQPSLQFCTATATRVLRVALEALAYLQ
jgi:hypothetical protein